MVAGISGGVANIGSLYSNFSFGKIDSVAQNENFAQLLDTNLVDSADSSLSKSEETNEMDLNGDGKISIDEILKYMELQMQDVMADNMDGSDMMQQNEERQSPFNQKLQVGIKQAISAYSAMI